MPRRLAYTREVKLTMIVKRLKIVKSESNDAQGRKKQTMRGDSFRT